MAGPGLRSDDQVLGLIFQAIRRTYLGEQGGIQTDEFGTQQDMYIFLVRNFMRNSHLVKFGLSHLLSGERYQDYWKSDWLTLRAGFVGDGYGSALIGTSWFFRKAELEVKIEAHIFDTEPIWKEIQENFCKTIPKTLNTIISSKSFHPLVFSGDGNPLPESTKVILSKVDFLTFVKFISRYIRLYNRETIEALVENVLQVLPEGAVVLFVDDVSEMSKEIFERCASNSGMKKIKKIKTAEPFISPQLSEDDRAFIEATVEPQMNEENYLFLYRKPLETDDD